MFIQDPETLDSDGSPSCSCILSTSFKRFYFEHGSCGWKIVKDEDTWKNRKMTKEEKSCMRKLIFGRKKSGRKTLPLERWSIIFNFPVVCFTTAPQHKAKVPTAHADTIFLCSNSTWLFHKIRRRQRGGLIKS